MRSQNFKKLNRFRHVCLAVLPNITPKFCRPADKNTSTLLVAHLVTDDFSVSQCSCCFNRHAVLLISSWCWPTTSTNCFSVINPRCVSSSTTSSSSSSSHTLSSVLTVLEVTRRCHGGSLVYLILTYLRFICFIKPFTLQYAWISAYISYLIVYLNTLL